MSDAKTVVNATRDNDSRCRLVVDAATERFPATPADGPSTPDWYDLVLTADEHDSVGLATPIKARGCTYRLPSDEHRRGRWNFRGETLRRLLARDGMYALGVYDKHDEISHLSLVPADAVVELTADRWTETDAGERAALPWSAVFNEDGIDRGEGPIPDGGMLVEAPDSEAEVETEPVDPDPAEREPEPTEVVFDPSNCDHAAVAAVLETLREEHELVKTVDEPHAVVYEVEAGYRGETQ